MIMNYDEATTKCRDVFLQKLAEYGETWRLLRLSSITERMLRIVRRIRRLDELGELRKSPEGEDVEYIGIANACVMALVKLVYTHFSSIAAYDVILAVAKNRMKGKKHDYNGEISLSTIINLLLVKIEKNKQIQDNAKSLVSKETTIEAGLSPQMTNDLINEYYDIFNLSILALLRAKGKNG